jgi:hypothetical protein
MELSMSLDELVDEITTYCLGPRSNARHYPDAEHHSYMERLNIERNIKSLIETYTKAGK